jgi:uncharacterized protein YggU (UPF0235/DUF167 family)
VKKSALTRTARNSPTSTFVSDAEVRVRVTPRGGRDVVIGIRGDNVLLLRVSAAPVDGAANRACIALLAETLDIKKSQISLIGGETSRDKRFRISGMAPEERDQNLALLPKIGGGSSSDDDDKMNEQTTTARQ